MQCTAQDIPRVTRSGSHTVRAKCDVCFLCAGPAHRFQPLCQVLTVELQKKVEKCAATTNNTELLAQIVAYGDLIAQEAKYHLQCLVKLYNSARRLDCVSQQDMDHLLCESLAFADLVAFVSMKLLESSNNIIFVMADLVRIFNARLSNLLGPKADSVPFIHSTRLREKLLARMPQLVAKVSGRDYVLMHCKAGRSVFTIPPTANALQQHALRAAYQAGHLWGMATNAAPCLPPPATSWGWMEEGANLVPLWMTLATMWAACRSLHICGCKTDCSTQRCGCRSSGLPCTPGCGCKGKCANKG